MVVSLPIVPQLKSRISPLLGCQDREMSQSRCLFLGFSPLEANRPSWSCQAVRSKRGHLEAEPGHILFLIHFGFLLAPLGLSLLTQSFKSEHLLGSSMIPCSGQQQLVPGSEPKAMLKKIDSATFNVCFYVLEIILNTQQHYRFNFLSLGYIIFSWWL